ncbi:MAG: cysteine desulfurase-like protein [Actinobacteria bacterium]|nr:MAG: cysteine desulfurase-like protein [Actinomycetota bacterium]
MSTVTLDVDAVRARFSALKAPTAYFDAPGGTQVPDSVIDAISAYLRESNANLGGAFRTSRSTDALLAQARLTAAAFLRCEPGEAFFGANMTTLNFMLSRTVGRTLRAGDEILVTRLEHDANISPWLELAHDIGAKVGFVDIGDDTTLDYDDLERQLTDRTRIVAFTLASNAAGTLTDAKRISQLAHDAGALAWADGVHYAPHGPIDVGELGVDVLLCSPYKFFGPHLGLAYVRPQDWRTYKVRPADSPYETGTPAHELLAGFVAAVEYIESLGWASIQAHERALGQQFLDGLPERCTLYGLPAMDGRVPTFAFTVDGLSPRAVAERLDERGLALWDGDYYAVEVMQRLGLGKEGAVRAGFVHYNTPGEVDRLLEALDEL